MVNVYGCVPGELKSKKCVLNRISLVGKILDTITLKMVRGALMLVGDDRKLQTIQFINQGKSSRPSNCKALIWFNHSRLGLLYTLQQPTP